MDWQDDMNKARAGEQQAEGWLARNPGLALAIGCVMALALVIALFT